MQVKTSIVVGLILGAIALILNILFFTEIMASPAGFVFLGTGIAPIFVLSAFFSINASTKLLKASDCISAGINTKYWLVALWLNRILSLLYIAFILWAFYAVLTVVLTGN